MLFLLAPLMRIVWDFRVIEVHNSSIPYLKHNIVTGITMLAQAIIIHLLLGAPLVDATLLSWGIYEILFDYGLNVMRNKPTFSYFGNFADKKNLSFIEEHIYAKLPWQLIGGVKLAFFIVTFVVYG